MVKRLVAKWHNAQYTKHLDQEMRKSNAEFESHKKLSIENSRLAEGAKGRGNDDDAKKFSAKAQQERNTAIKAATELSEADEEPFDSRLRRRWRRQAKPSGPIKSKTTLLWSRCSKISARRQTILRWANCGATCEPVLPFVSLEKEFPRMKPLGWPMKSPETSARGSGQN